MSSSGDIQVLFHEEQRFRQPILWICLVVFAAFSLGTAVYILRTAASRDGSETVSWLSWGMLFLLGVLPVVFTLGFFTIAKLQVEVSTEGLFVRFFPFHWKVRKIDLDDVEDIEAITYHPVRDYGGYGIRCLPRAKAYNTGGNAGVRISYRNGYHLLIGTAYPRELQLALTQVLPTTGDGTWPVQRAKEEV